MAKLKIRKLDPMQVKAGSTILVVGRRGTGKSTMLTDLCHCFASRRKPDGEPLIDLALGFSSTEESNQTLSQFLPPSLIYSDFSEERIAQIIAHQRRACKRGTQKNIMLLLDDCGFDKASFRSTTLRNLFLNGRHLKITCIVCLQYALDCPPDIRGNVDVVIAARDPIHSSRSKLWQNFFGCFETYESFSLTLDMCTNNFETLVMWSNQDRPMNHIEEQIRWYKAQVREPFRLGADVYFRLDSRFYCDREEELEQQREAAREHERRRQLARAPIGNVAKVDEDGQTMVPRHHHHGG